MTGMCAIDFGEEVEEHRRLGAEARNQRDPVGEQLVGGERDDVVRVEMAIACVQRRGLVGHGAGAIEGERDRVKRRHRAPP